MARKKVLDKPFVDPKEWANDYNFTTDRRPKGLVGGYAPGNYMSRCRKCDRSVMGVDKYATSCFACGVDVLIDANNDMQRELRELREFKSKMTTAAHTIRSLFDGDAVNILKPDGYVHTAQVFLQEGK